jgi:hypothetical protein
VSNGISIRKFADRVGVSDTAVRKAISAGKITSIDYTDPRRPKLDPDKCAAEWNKHYDPDYHRTDRLSGNIDVKKSDQNKNHSSNSDINFRPPSDAGNPSEKSLADIKRQISIVKLANETMDLKKKQGILVEKDKVYAALFSLGKEVRSVFQQVPDRIIDDLLAANGRNEAHLILSNAINNALFLVADMLKKDIDV